MNKIDQLAKEILEKKLELEKLKLKPRIVLLDNDLFNLLNDGWLESIQDLPWADTLAYEIEKNKERNYNVFLADSTIFGLWVVRVDTIKGFRVF